MSRSSSYWVADFKDGSVVRAFPNMCIQSLRGYRLDQIILADDSRKQIYDKRYDDIKFIFDNCMMITCIPEEFRIMYLDVDCPREGEE